MKGYKVLSICFLLAINSEIVQAQTRNWLNLDLKDDGVFGISTKKAYSELLVNKKAKQVIVAVIDTGVDTTHKALKCVLWVNKNEIPNNGKDDDGNGFIDDIHGWNFINSGINDHSDKEDIACIISKQKAFFDSLSNTFVSEEYREKYKEYRRILKVYYEFSSLAKKELSRVNEMQEDLEQIVQESGLLIPICVELHKYRPIFMELKKRMDDLFASLSNQIEYGLNIKDNCSLKDSLITYARFSGGDNNVFESVLQPAFDAYHGTHVAGIIAAIKNEDIGIQGVADNVLIMPLKINSLFKEPCDRNLAAAIKYAVDNGAKVINMSFGKSYAYDKKVVDDAVKYAMMNDVLIVHAAMNNGQNLDITPHYPNKYYEGGGYAEAWIEVGASRWKDDSTLVASFSNYGKQTVDCFAPGERIYSTIPGGRFEYDNGTSMATPVVAGLAAIIRGYCPELTASQVKNIILNSVIKVNHNVIVRNKDEQLQSVPFYDICTSGGIVNMYHALNLAFSSLLHDK